MVAAVLLAAGAGTRFAGDSHKLLAPLRGRPVLAHALDAAIGSGLDLFVVTGAVDVSALVPEDAVVVANPRWAEGQATSVRAGIEAARAVGHDAVVVGLGDQPFVPASAWRAVAASSAPMAVADYADAEFPGADELADDGASYGAPAGGHPVRLGAEVWDLLPETGDAVGRIVRARRPELVVRIRCPIGSTHDIDTLEDLHRWS